MSNTDPTLVRPRVRKLACGRRAVIGMLDSLLAQEDNIRKMAKAFQMAVDTDPLSFYKDIVMKLTPASMLEEGGGQARTADEQARALQLAFAEMMKASGGLMAALPSPHTQTDSGPTGGSGSQTSPDAGGEDDDD